MFTAVGVHVFAGGFTRGFQMHENCEVLAQLEIHGLGLETASSLGIDVHHTDSWQEWPKLPCDCLYGNPRCTGFSCVTGGYASHAHGPWSKQTVDVHDLVQYAMSLSPQPSVIVWESVQQAYSVGKPLLDYLLSEYFEPNGYKVAHLFINAASFGNAQNRKRYFMFAYKSDKRFNISPPKLPEYRTVLRDVIGDMETQYEYQGTFKHSDLHYSLDSSLYLDEDAQFIVDQLPRGYNFNTFARYYYDKLPPRYRAKWDDRISEMPFSMHCPYKLNYDSPAPTLWGSCQFVHPTQNRLLTIREIATIMGWDFFPVGRTPIGQIAKGIVPAVGTWLAEQVTQYLSGSWGSDDFASKYKSEIKQWIEAPMTHNEKVFDLTEFKTNRDKGYEEWVASIT